MAKKRNPQDTTLRNINALKKRVTTLEEQVASLEAQIEEHSAWQKRRDGDG